MNWNNSITINTRNHKIIFIGTFDYNIDCKIDNCFINISTNEIDSEILTFTPIKINRDPEFKNCELCLELNRSFNDNFNKLINLKHIKIAYLYKKYKELIKKNIQIKNDTNNSVGRQINIINRNLIIRSLFIMIKQLLFNNNIDELENWCINLLEFQYLIDEINTPFLGNEINTSPSDDK